MVASLRFFAVAATMMLLLAAPAAARSPALAIAEQAEAPAPVAGISRLQEDALVFRPRSLATGPVPLLVLFHGAGMTGRQMIDGLAAEAERCACLLLAVRSGGATWDLVTATRQAQRAGGRTTASRLFGGDVDRVERALSSVIASRLVDRRRIVMVGFSDGASYALSLGLANPSLVRGVVAIAPGFHLEPTAIDPRQRLFVAHSPEDRVLSFANSRDGIFASLRRAGFAAQFRSYPGGHAIDPAVVREGVEHVIGPASPAAR